MDIASNIKLIGLTGAGLAVLTFLGASVGNISKRQQKIAYFVTIGLLVLNFIILIVS